MPALTQDRNTKRRDGELFVGPVAASKKIFTGALVCTDASGNITPGATATTLMAVGVAQETVDNSSGAAGDKKVEYRKGLFNFENSTSTDAITRSDIEKDCYIVDDQTVAKTNGSNTRSIAGKVKDIDPSGNVWVKIA